MVKLKDPILAVECALGTFGSVEHATSIYACRKLYDIVKNPDVPDGAKIRIADVFQHFATEGVKKLYMQEPPLKDEEVIEAREILTAICAKAARNSSLSGTEKLMALKFSHSEAAEKEKSETPGLWVRGWRMLMGSPAENLEAKYYTEREALVRQQGMGTGERLRAFQEATSDVYTYGPSASVGHMVQESLKIATDEKEDPLYRLSAMRFLGDVVLDKGGRGVGAHLMNGEEKARWRDEFKAYAMSMLDDPTQRVGVRIAGYQAALGMGNDYEENGRLHAREKKLLMSEECRLAICDETGEKSRTLTVDLLNLPGYGSTDVRKKVNLIGAAEYGAPEESVAWARACRRYPIFMEKMLSDDPAIVEARGELERGDRGAKIEPALAQAMGISEPLVKRFKSVAFNPDDPSINLEVFLLPVVKAIESSAHDGIKHVPFYEKDPDKFHQILQAARYAQAMERHGISMGDSVVGMIKAGRVAQAIDRIRDRDDHPVSPHSFDTQVSDFVTQMNKAVIRPQVIYHAEQAGLPSEQIVDTVHRFEEQVLPRIAPVAFGKKVMPDAIWEQVRAWHREVSTINRDIVDEKHVSAWPGLTPQAYTIPDGPAKGYVILPLTETAQLKEIGKPIAEGGHGHCIGGYTDEFRSGRSHGVAIYDPAGQHLSSAQLVLNDAPKKAEEAHMVWRQHYGPGNAEMLGTLASTALDQYIQLFNHPRHSQEAPNPYIDDYRARRAVFNEEHYKDQLRTMVDFDWKGTRGPDGAPSHKEVAFEYYKPYLPEGLKDTKDNAEFHAKSGLVADVDRIISAMRRINPQAGRDLLHE